MAVVLRVSAVARMFRVRRWRFLMMVWRSCTRLAAAAVIALLGVQVLEPASPASAADGRRPAGFFDQLLSIFAPRPAQNQPAPGLVNSRHTSADAADNPMFPYAGGRDSKRRQSAAYRTVCVRLCDGYYWPVSEAATEARFGHDSNTCESSCAQPAKLYYAPRDQSDASELIGLDGKPYAALPNAFLYRKSLQPQCQCKPSPWSDSEVARHQQYAAEARANEQQVAMAVVPSEDAAPPLPALGAAAVVAADGAIAANADTLPLALRPTSDKPPVATPAKLKRALKPASSLLPLALGGTLLAQPATDALSFSVQTIDRSSHRYVPLR